MTGGGKKQTEGRPPQISVGDYVRAVRALGAAGDADEPTRRAVARCLGLFEDEPQPEAQPGADEAARAAPDSTGKTKEGDGDADEVAGRKAAVEGGNVVESGLEQLKSGAAPGPAPDWLRLSGSLRAAAGAAATAPASADEPPPLLLPRWVRSILTALLSTQGLDGQPDVERAVEIIARREPLAELPGLPSLTTRRGVQLLIDMGDGMLPFGRDQSGLMREVLHVIGGEAASVLRFKGSPLRGAGAGSRRTWRAYVPPPAGTPVLLLTDFGIGAAADAAPPAEWLEFADLLRRAGCPAVALVPYPAARWPAPLARALHLVEWGRRTTVATARRLVGRGLEVKR